MRIAIVTGASSGLGREYARWVDRHRTAGRGFDELWLVARRRERLEALAAELQINTRVFALDLATRQGIDELARALGACAGQDADRVQPATAETPQPAPGTSQAVATTPRPIPRTPQPAPGTSQAVATTPRPIPRTPQPAPGTPQSNIEVGFLVNAAGYGRFQYVENMPLDDIEQMVNLNCRAVVEVTRLCLPYMHRGARVLQIASCAAFQPLQGLSEYAATKSFVLSYTRSQRWELMGRGIYMTAVCPIWVKTEFNQVARSTAVEPQVGKIAADGHGEPGAAHNGSHDAGGKPAVAAASPQPKPTVAHTFPNLSPRRVVEWSTFVNSLNYPVATCDVVPFVMRVAGKVLPAPVVMAAWEGLRRI